MDLSVFLLSTSTRLGGFLLIDLVSSSSYPLGLRAWYSGIWFFLLTFLFIGKRLLHPFHETNTKQRWWMTRSTELAPRKKSNCNVVATWPRYMISLIIISNNIPLSLPIALTYRLVPDGLPFQYTKFYSSIIKNQLFYIALLRNTPSVISLQFQYLLTNIPFVGMWLYSIGSP